MISSPTWTKPFQDHPAKALGAESARRSGFPSPLDLATEAAAGLREPGVTRELASIQARLASLVFDPLSRGRQPPAMRYPVGYAPSADQ